MRIDLALAHAEVASAVAAPVGHRLGTAPLASPERLLGPCLDDIGYVRQDRAEMEVLFALLAERYERLSVMITSILVFSQGNQIFHDDMTAAAAIDRVVHHSVILELTVPSYRAEAARARTQNEER